MNKQLDRTGSAIGNFLGAIARFAIALFGALLMVGALFIGLLVGLTLMLFALLRGRKPTGLKFMWRKGEWPGRPGSRRAARPADAHEVVDIEAREIPPGPTQDR